MKAKIQANLTKSMVKLAKELDVAPRTVGRAEKNLGLTSYIRRCHQLLSNTTMKTRVTMGKKLLNWIKETRSRVCIFSDNKMWTVDQSQNWQNDRYLASWVKEVPPINSTKFCIAHDAWSH